MNETWLLEPTASQELLNSYNLLHDNPEFLAVKRAKQAEGGSPEANLPWGELTANYGGVKVIRVTGIITPRYDPWFHDIYDYVALDLLTETVKKALSDDKVTAIVFFVDTRGGDVTGVNEFNQLIFEARKIKPIFTYVIGSMCSGGLWAFSASHVVLADATARLGSLGVVSIFQDRSRYYEKMGVRFVEVVSTRSPNKRLNPTKGEGLKETVKMLDDIADVMIDSVARNYVLTYDQVMNSFGQGSVFVGQTALQRGMCHALISFEEMLTQVQNQVDPQEIAQSAVKNFTPIQVSAARLLTSGPSDDPPAGQADTKNPTSSGNARQIPPSKGARGMSTQDNQTTTNGENMPGENEENTVEFTKQDKETLDMMADKTTSLAEDVGQTKDQVAAYDKKVEEQTKTIAEQTKTIEKQNETIQAQEEKIKGLEEKLESQATELSSLTDRVKALLSDDEDGNQELLGGNSTEQDQINKMV